MKKNVKRLTFATLSIVLILLLLTACGDSSAPELNPEPPPVETPAPSPEPIEPDPAPLPIEDNRLGVNLNDLVNSCPSTSRTYEGDLFSCNLDNLVMFTIVGDVSNPEKFGVLFYASAYNDYQNEQVAQILNMMNAKFFTNYIGTTKDIILEATQSVLSDGEKRYLYRDGYNIELYGNPAQDGGGSVAAYYITK